MASHVQTSPFWKSISVRQLSMNVEMSPSANGFSSRSCRSVLAGASTIHTSGTTKNSAKATSSSAAKAPPSHAPGETTRPGVPRARSLSALKQAAPENKEDAQNDRDQQENQRDSGRAVEVALLEGIEEGELVQRIFLALRLRGSPARARAAQRRAGFHRRRRGSPCTRSIFASAESGSTRQYGSGRRHRRGRPRSGRD